MLLAICDIQLLTGLGILLSGFIGLSCYVSAYHWQLIVYLAWFSNLTHAACLSSLRTYLYKHQTERNWRLALMLLLLTGLVTALIPTAYFNWESTKSDDWWYIHESSITNTSANARCFFNQIAAKAAWIDICAQTLSNSACSLEFDSAQGTTAYETQILSLILLLFNFITRFSKVFRTLSHFSRRNIRDKIGHLGLSMIDATTSLYRRSYSSSHPIIRYILAIFRPLDIILAAYLLMKLYADILSSELSDVSGFQASPTGTDSALICA